jgi:putative FmdB family regulatory protein
MPIYDYRCSACGHLIEVVHGIYDHGPKFCPECGAEATMSKGFTTPAIHFKGSGWAKKDRSTTSSAKAASGPDSTDATSTTSADGQAKDASAAGAATSATKPEATKESKPATSTGSAD